MIYSLNCDLIMSNELQYYLYLHLHCTKIFQQLFHCFTLQAIFVRNMYETFFDKMRQRPNCTDYGINEFRTTKLCSICFREQEQTKKYGRVKKKKRYYWLKIQKQQCLPAKFIHENRISSNDRIDQILVFAQHRSFVGIKNLKVI